METIKPASDFHAGLSGQAFREELKSLFKSQQPGEHYCLDLSEVTYMDTYTFRLVFDYLPNFRKVIPPESDHVVKVYNGWLDSKKWLTK